MKTFLIATCAIVVSTAIASAQPIQSQGQIGSNGEARLNSGQTTGIATPQRGGRSRGAAQVTGNPNGTADGPTTLSGTGPSTYGGNNPGAAR